MYIQIAYKPSNTHPIIASTIKTTTTMVNAIAINGTTEVCVKQPECPTEKKIILIRNITTQVINITRYYDVNLTGLQKKKLLNLKAFKCPSGGCGYGYYLAKNDALDIFGIPHTKYSEAPPTEIPKSNVPQTGYLKTETDGAGHLIIFLNMSYWEKIAEKNKEIIVTLSRYNETNDNDTYYNETRNKTLWVRYRQLSQDVSVQRLIENSNKGNVYTD